MKRFLLLLLMAAAPSLASAQSWKVGQPFPQLSLPIVGQADESASVAKFRGDKLMLHVFASW